LRVRAAGFFEFWFRVRFFGSKISSFLRMWCALPRSRSRAGAAVDDGSAGGFLLLFALLWKFKLYHRLPRLVLVDFCNAII
jgi:hypothetical protein